MNAEDQTELRRVVHEANAGERVGGLVLIVIALLSGLVGLLQLRDAMYSHTFVDSVMRVDVGSFLAIAPVAASLGLLLFVRFRKPEGTKLYRALLEQGHEIESVRFVNVVNRMWDRIVIRHPLLGGARTLAIPRKSFASTCALFVRNFPGACERGGR